MEKDIVPELLDKLTEDFGSMYNKSKKIAKLKGIEKKSFNDAYSYALEIGNIQAKVFKKNISSAVLPDGKMYYNIAERIINGTLPSDYKLISEYYLDMQNTANKASGIGLKAKISALNKDRLDGFIERLSSGEEYDKIAWILDEPIKNFALNIVDESIKSNADFLSDAGVTVTVTRTSEYNCCKWCDDLAGTYTAPFDSKIFARHDNCRCTIESSGKKMRTSGRAFAR